MSNYIINVQASPTGERNPEFAPEKKLADGIEADGFLIMTMKDDRPNVTTMYGLTTLDLARVLANERSEAGSVIWEAIAIAEGLVCTPLKFSHLAESTDTMPSFSPSNLLMTG